MERPPRDSGSLSDEAIRAIQKSKHKLHAILTRLTLPPSPTPYLLCSNELPSEMEHTLILNTILKAQAKSDQLLAVLASERMVGISTVSHKLAQVHLDRVNKTLLKHRSILSPIRRIPAEVLEEIFAFSITGCEYSEMGSQGFRRESYSIPQSQSQVCQFWRGVALSSPKLWSRIPTIKLDSPYSRHPAFLEFLADLLDRRCRNVPINFHIQSCSKSDSFKPHPAVAMLVSHSTKWKTAILGMPWFKESELWQIKGRIPQLETLALSFLRWYPGFPTVIDVFQLAPQLREVMFVSGAFPFRFLLPHDQLLVYRHATHHHPSYEPNDPWHPDNLSEFTSLRTLELGQLYTAELGASGARFTNLTMLKLQISYHDGNHQLRLLERLILPALKDISIFFIVSDPGVDPSLLSLILDLILRSGIPSIERLHARSRSREQAGVLTSLLHHLPFLTHLNVNLPPVEDLTQLAQPVDVTGIVPLLQVCSFYSREMLDDREANLCHQLALRRCEAPINYHGPTAHRMRALYIEGIDSRPHWDMNAAAMVMHGWRENAVTAYLKACKGSLVHHIDRKREVRRPINYDRRSLPPGKSYCSRVVLSILASIEQMEITRAEDLYASRVFQAIYGLTDSTEEKPSKKYYTRASQQILDKWKPLIDSSFDQVHWGIHKNHIFYVPTDSPFRASSNSMTKLLLQQLQFDKDIPEVECPWPPTPNLKDTDFF